MSPGVTVVVNAGVEIMAGIAAGIGSGVEIAGETVAASGTVTLAVTSAPGKGLDSVVKRPGTHSSITIWKLVPPKPKDETPARRISPSGLSQGRNVVLTKNGRCSKSIFGFGLLKLAEGGRTLSYSAITALNKPAAPAALLR